MVLKDRYSNLMPSTSCDETPQHTNQEAFNTIILDTLAKLEHKLANMAPEQANDLIYESETESQQSDNNWASQLNTWDTSTAFDPASMIENQYFQDSPQEVAK